MKKKVVLLTLIVVLGAILFGTGGNPATAQAENPLEMPVDQIIIKYKDTANLNAAAQAGAENQMQRINEVAGVTITYFRSMSGDAHVMRLAAPVSTQDALAITKRISGLPEVEYAEPDYLVFTLEGRLDVSQVPNDTYYSDQWHYSAPGGISYGVNAPAAWDITTGASNVYVAVLDTGITDHVDLANRWIGGYDMISDYRIANDGDGRDADPHDPGDWITSAESSSGFFYNCPVGDSSWHGTHVAGTIGAASNNNTGVAGLNWVSKVVPVRVLGKCGNYSSDIADGIRWAAGVAVSGTPANPYPAQVLNMSLGGYNPTGCSSTYQSAIDAAFTAGAVVIVSSGNSNDDASLYQPASCNNVVTVGSTNRYGNRAYYSNYGVTVEISAPGGETTVYGNGVLSTLNTGTQGPVGDTYEYYQGTSMAAPHVSGVASLMYSLNPALTPAQVSSIMRGNVTPFPAGSTCSTSTCGTGIVNAAAALLAVPGAEPATPVLSPISNADGDGSFTVDWSDAAFADTYTLEEADNAAFTLPATAYNGANSQASISGKTGGTWYYRVRANNGEGSSSWSNTESVTVKPAAPVLSAISNPGNTDAYTITWSAPTGAQGYLLQESGEASFSSVTTRYLGSNTQYVVTGQAGGDWYYRVQAYNAAGDSPWSNNESTTVNPSSIDAVNLLPINNPDTEKSYTVDWDDVVSATSYILEESDNPYFVDSAVVYSGPLTQVMITDQTGGTWYYRARALGASDQGPWSNTQSTLVETIVYLPVVLNNYGSTQDDPGPTPGYWEADYEEFYVTPDGGSVDRFASYIYVDGCGNYKITHISPVPAIVSNQFSYSGSFYFSGTFDSPLTASGIDGFINFDLSGCGTINGGPWSWDADWIDSSQPTFLSAELVVPELIEPMPDFTKAYEVTKLDQ